MDRSCQKDYEVSMQDQADRSVDGTYNNNRIEFKAITSRNP